MEKLFSGWGRNKFFKCKTFSPKSLKDLQNIKNQQIIARGKGRSYGNSSIKRKYILLTKNLNRVIKLDQKKRIIEVEAGIDIKELLKELIPKKLFLPVTPGSKFISIGGMIASDVHGKNHHKLGSFRHHIIELKIVDEKGKLHICTKSKNKNLFNYTIGGMGLTGIIYSCKFKLLKIKSDKIIQEKIKTKNLSETMDRLKEGNDWEYNVGWIDSSAKNNELGRSIIFKGNHSKQKLRKSLKFKDNSLFSLRNLFPSWLMNRYIIKLLNVFYYNLSFNSKNIVSINDFFYQLDKIKNWNLIYGKKGFISYQLVIPEKNSFVILSKLLRILSTNQCYSFVSVIKFLGKNDGYNSFGMRGFTLVFDFPIYKNIISVIRMITNLIILNNGRIYLCKDSLLNYREFKKMKTGFSDRDFLRIRKSKKKYFNSEQSKRLDI